MRERPLTTSHVCSRPTRPFPRGRLGLFGLVASLATVALAAVPADVATARKRVEAAGSGATAEGGLGWVAFEDGLADLLRYHVALLRAEDAAAADGARAHAEL